MPSYDITNPQIADTITNLIEKNHPELLEAGATVDTIFAFDDKGGFPVKTNGYPSAANIKISNLKSRVKGALDAEIVIDRDAFNAMNELQREALLDRELYRLVVVRDKEGLIKTDDAGRVKLKIKKFDYMLGWFKEIAERHGENSPELYQANILWQRDGRTFFPKA
jgi:hypothetical protein